MTNEPFWHFLTIFQSDMFDIENKYKELSIKATIHRSGMCPFSGMHFDFVIDSRNFLQRYDEYLFHAYLTFCKDAKMMR